MSSSHFDVSSLKTWFLNQKRDLPWRHSPTPYEVWISEVMLQQTQVAVVIPYYLRWMERFPTLESLAAASLDEVIKMWEGLGYYSRARHLHEGAKYIVEHHQGQFPQQEQALQKIKGLGPYTVGALLSFAFHQKKAAVDGNVVRVLTRYFGIKDDIAKSSTSKRLRLLADAILPEEEPWIMSEALIELGATICQKKARCLECPLQSSCYSNLHGKADQLPMSSKRTQRQCLYRAVAVIEQAGHFLIKRDKKGEIMCDLHEFPYWETSALGIKDTQFIKLIKEKCQFAVEKVKALPSVSHSFTRFQVQLNPILFTCREMFPVEELEWMPLKRLKQLAFSSGHRKIFQQILQIVD